MSAGTPTGGTGVPEPQAPDRLGWRQALDDISVRLWAVSHNVGDPSISAAELCEDAEELGAVARRIQRLVGRCRETP
jgi:hypothetical protein